MPHPSLETKQHNSHIKQESKYSTNFDKMSLLYSMKSSVLGKKSFLPHENMSFDLHILFKYVLYVRTIVSESLLYILLVGILNMIDLDGAN
jgi:hypothetical protein